MSNEYWSTGIVLRHLTDHGWSARLSFFTDSIEGELRTRYFDSLTTALDTLIGDAAKLKVVFRLTLRGKPSLWYEADGEDKDWPPPANYRQILAKQAERIGWATYEVATDD